MGKSLVTTAHINRTFDLLAEGRALREIAKVLNLKVVTLYDAIMRDPKTAELYERARELQAENEADEIKDIADTEPNPQTARNRIDVRKWRASKFRPKKFGDKLDLNVITTVDMGAVMERAKSRLRPGSDQHGIVYTVVPEESTTNEPGPADNESAGSPPAVDIFSLT